MIIAFFIFLNKGKYRLFCKIYENYADANAPAFSFLFIA